MATGEPADVRRDRGTARLDATVVNLDTLERGQFPGNLRIFQVLLRRRDHSEQARRRHPCHGPFAPSPVACAWHRGDDTSLQLEHLQVHRHDGDLVGFHINRHLSEHHPDFGREGPHLVQRRLACCPLPRTAFPSMAQSRPVLVQCPPRGAALPPGTVSDPVH